MLEWKRKSPDLLKNRIELELRSSDARIGIFTDHGEQEEKLSETRTTLAHLASL
jgi:hypothetical protein